MSPTAKDTTDAWRPLSRIVPSEPLARDCTAVSEPAPAAANHGIHERAPLFIDAALPRSCNQLSMEEVPGAGGVHRDARFLSSREHLVVSYRAPGWTTALTPASIST